MVDRRHFLKATAAGLVGTAFFRAGPAESSPAAAPYQLTAARGTYRFSNEQPSPAQVMFYNRSIPGPVIRMRQGEESIVRFHNALDEPSSVHWHGLRIDNAMDGVPGVTQAPVQPGEQFEYRLTPPDAGTYWYHTHQRSWAQLALGLAGILIVEEEHPPLVDQDLIFAIDDWRLDREMQFDTQSLGSLHDWSHGGRFGNYITVNGELGKNFTVSSGERIRLRMVNIANSRTMKLLINQPEVSVIAVDGQPVKPFAPDSGTITLAPGQRSDLIIDMTSGPKQASPIELLVRDNAYQIASFEFDEKVKREQLLASPIALRDNPANRIALPDEFQNFPLHMEGGAMGGMRAATYQGKRMDVRELIQYKKIWSINGFVDMPPEPLFTVKRGTAISLDINNDNAWPHAMHIHGHHFIYDRSPEIWRDTVLLNRQEKGSMKFLADNPGKWLIHCHMVEHMAAGMVTWFEVS